MPRRRNPANVSAADSLTPQAPSNDSRIARAGAEKDERRSDLGPMRTRGHESGTGPARVASRISPISRVARRRQPASPTGPVRSLRFPRQQGRRASSLVCAHLREDAGAMGRPELSPISPKSTAPRPLCLVEQKPPRRLIWCPLRTSSTTPGRPTRGRSRDWWISSRLTCESPGLRGRFCRRRSCRRFASAFARAGWCWLGGLFGWGGLLEGDGEDAWGEPASPGVMGESWRGRRQEGAAVPSRGADESMAAIGNSSPE